MVSCTSWTCTGRTAAWSASGFGSETFAKRAFDCLNMYVFPNEDSLLFAFYYKPKQPVPFHLNGWNVYNPLAEFKRLGHTQQGAARVQQQQGLPPVDVVPGAAGAAG